jgi:hypothetical protein
MATYYILDKSYMTTTANIPSGRVVVFSNTDGSVSLPTAANNGKIAGISVHGQNTAGYALSVRKAGIAHAVAAASIAAGDAVIVADEQGRVKSVVGQTAGTKLEVVGFAESSVNTIGQIVEILVSPHQRTA